MIRERDRRVNLDISCWLEVEDGMFCVTTFDISDTGVSLLSSHLLTEGRIVLLKFFTPFSAEPVTVRGEVIWGRTEPEGVMGIRFLDIHEKTRCILRSTAHLLRARDNSQ
jgi:hypothetical protein